MTALLVGASAAAASAGTAAASVEAAPVMAATAAEPSSAAHGGTLPGLPSSNWYLYGVDMLSDTDGWAVGGRSFSFSERPWIGHWNGQRWQRTPTPRRYTGDLSDVVAVASDDVWAVGRLAKGKVGPLTLHWDGVEWRRYGHSPSDGALAGVSATGPNDVWAVGIMDQSGLVEHWNGTHWDAQQPDVAQGMYIKKVAALSPSNVWAITDQSVIHWNGSTWQRVSLPDLGGAFVFSDIAMRTSGDGWVVGQSSSASDSVPIAVHWNGKDWKEADAAVPGGTYAGFTSVSSSSSEDAWAVGSQMGADVDHLVIEHWDGHAWRLAEAPASPTGYRFFASVDALADDDIWTVGDIYEGPPNGFIAHWDGQSWTVEP